MSLDEGVSRFIGRLYEDVYDADAWRDAVAELMRRTGSRLAFICAADLRHREYSRAEFYAPETSSVADGIAEYNEEMHRFDPSLIWASNHLDAGVCDTAKLMPADDFRRHPYVTWQCSRFGTSHWRVFYSRPVDDLSFALSLHPPGEEGPASRETGLLHALLFEHMERAVRLAARPPDLSSATEALFALDKRGHVLSMSPRAEQVIALNDGLEIDRRMLKSSSMGVNERLDAAIASAIERGRIGAVGGGVRIQRSSGTADWLALVSACPRRIEHLPTPAPAALLRLVETASRHCLPPAASELFDLTTRELEVADGFVRGHSLESLCQVLGISRNTAKVHLQSLFRKTRTNRQAELVQLLDDVTRA